MTDIKVYQIGLGNFGQNGFKKLINIHNRLAAVDVEFVGFAEPDLKKGVVAQKFAAAKGVKLDHFESTPALYQSASKQKERVLIYDSGPSENHANNICTSMRLGLYHLAEKPSSLNREQYIKTKNIERNSNVFYMINFIEMESPVVKRAIQLLQNKSIDHIKTFRENSIGVLRFVQPMEREGVQGGNVLDKMWHELFILGFLKASGKKSDLELQQVYNHHLDLGRTSSGSIETKPYNEKQVLTAPTSAAVTQTKAIFCSDSVNIQLHSSWGGLSNDCRKVLNKYESALGHKISVSDRKRVGNYNFNDEEARFFIVRGEKNLLGDLLHNHLYDLNKNTIIDIQPSFDDKLHRILKKAILRAVGKSETDIIDKKEIDHFINALFDIKQAVEDRSDRQIN
jgi:hypothetical protein